MAGDGVGVDVIGEVSSSWFFMGVRASGDGMRHERLLCSVGATDCVTSSTGCSSVDGGAKCGSSSSGIVGTPRYPSSRYKSVTSCDNLSEIRRTSEAIIVSYIHRALA